MGRRKNVIDPNNEKSLAVMEKMAVDIEKARELYGDGQPFDEERVLDCLVFRAERTTEELLHFGRYCLWLKAEVGHGRFLDDLKRRNLNSTAANWAMLIYEKLGSNSATLQNLGPSKARYLTFFTKEEIDTYGKGGPLGAIPHDDVAKMSTRELEAEVRELRKKRDDDRKSSDKAIFMKEKKISELEAQLRWQGPPTKEQLAGAKLGEYLKPFDTQLQDAIFAMNSCIDMITEVQRIEAIGYAQLNDFILKHTKGIAMITEAFGELQGAINAAILHLSQIPKIKYGNRITQGAFGSI